MPAGARLNRAAEMRAAATQRKLQERQAEEQGVMSRSPDRWLRAAAAEGLSLREAAVFASPGKSARPHYHPLPSARRSAGGSSGAGSAAPRSATPGDSRFDSFSAGEAGAEPYSARVHTVDRRQEGSSAAPQEPPAPARGGGLDFAKLAADREAYLEVRGAGLHGAVSSWGVGFSLVCSRMRLLCAHLSAAGCAYHAHAS